MDAKHTEGPWESFGNGICRKADATHIVLMPARNMRPADIERTVACVNACEGINPDAVRDVLAALEAVIEWLDHNGAWSDVQAAARAVAAKAKGA